MATSELTRLEAESLVKNDQNYYQRTKDMGWLDSHMEDGGMMRCLANIREEAAQEKELQERTDHAALVNERSRKETALCSEIKKIRDEKLSEEYRRQQLRDNDPGLQELTRRLRASYVCRDQKLQILHNEYRRLQDKQEQSQANRQLQSALYEERTDAARRQEMEAKRVADHCRSLQQQIVDGHRRKQCQYEDTLIEKKMMDDIMRTIYEEDMRELQQKREKTEQIRREQKLHREAQQAWRDKHKQLLYREERRIEQQAREMADRDAILVAERKKRLEIKEEINKRVIAMILKEEAEKEERNNVINSLQEQEYLEKSLNDAAAEKEKLARIKLDNKVSLTAQMETRRELTAREREQERKFRLDIDNLSNKESEIEREKQRQKREKQLQYTRELKQQIRENELKRARERDIENARSQYVRDYDQQKEQQIASERERLIEDHVPHLLGYLRPGTIRREDLPVVRKGASGHPELSSLNIEPLAQQDVTKRSAKCNAQCQILRLY